MSAVQQSNISVLKNTIKCQQVELNVLKHDYAELKRKYEALINSMSENSQQTGGNEGSETEPPSNP